MTGRAITNTLLIASSYTVHMCRKYCWTVELRRLCDVYIII